MSSITAYGSDYFGECEFPLLIGRSMSHPPPLNPDTSPPHPHDLTTEEHHHDFCELVIVNKGIGLQNLEGLDMPITVGDVFLLQGQQRHYFHQRQNLEIINVMYNPEQIKLPENELRQMPGYCAMFLLEPTYRKWDHFASGLHLNLEQLIEVKEIILRMEAECSEKASGYEVVLRAKLLELIAYLSRAYEGGKCLESKALLRLGNVIGCLDRDYQKEWKLDELIEIAHMSKSSFLETFKKATGHSPLNYLMQIRIQRAITLMRQPELNITEIAYSVGFNDSNYFTRQFRKLTGKTPREYRQKSL